MMNTLQSSVLCNVVGVLSLLVGTIDVMIIV